MVGNGDTLEELIARWRDYRRPDETGPSPETEELESGLRDEVDALVAVGLAVDEAFLVAVKRIGDRDAVSQEFVREHSGRLWQQPVADSDSNSAPELAPDYAPAPSAASGRAARTEAIVVLSLAVAAGLAVKVPELFGQQLTGGDEGFYARNFSFFVLPFLTAYFAWKRRLNPIRCLWLVLPFIGAVVFANAYPFNENSATLTLTVLHLPLVLWTVVGIAYAGDRWRAVAGRMDFIRFSGEFFIYYVLIALGGGVLTGLTFVLFIAISLDVSVFLTEWLLPGGALGAVIICAWLVESKQGLMESLAPMLTRVFTPLVAVLLLAFLAAIALTGSGIDPERQVLIGFDLLLVLVLGLLLYSVSARDPQAPPNWFDALTALLVVSAIIADGVALSAIVARITEFGFSANKTAALGENLILLVNLAWSAWLYARFLRRRGNFAALERWQTAYLPVYAGWAAVVVVAFPPVFGWA